MAVVRFCFHVLLLPYTAERYVLAHHFCFVLYTHHSAKQTNKQKKQVQISLIYFNSSSIIFIIPRFFTEVISRHFLLNFLYFIQIILLHNNTKKMAKNNIIIIFDS